MTDPSLRTRVRPLVITLACNSFVTGMFLMSGIVQWTKGGWLAWLYTALFLIVGATVVYVARKILREVS